MPGVPSFSRRHEPVFRRPVPVTDLPPEDVPVKLYGSFGFISAYLEVYDPVHERLSSVGWFLHHFKKGSGIGKSRKVLAQRHDAAPLCNRSTD